MITDALLRDSLGSKPIRIPSAFLYDDLGSALFDVITLLPEYPLARIGADLLHDSLPELVQLGADRIIELGPGSGKLSSLLLQALAARQKAVEFTAVDISDYALNNCQQTLERIAGVRVQAVKADYVDGLRQATEHQARGTRNMILFLGSTLSNFEPREVHSFLGDVRALLREGDALLLAVDLEKDPGALLRAYDDSLGVTAAFNKNVLVRLNRQWQANFPLEAFVHRSSWNADHRRVEMHLHSTMDCTVSIPRLQHTLKFRAGESLWTESSYRFSLREITDWVSSCRFRVARQWLNHDWPFAQLLLLAR